jgi:FKBP-type peptidyl-prolyl cis-trans isomerase SlyD
MQVANDKVVSLAYTLRDAKGEILDSANASDPLHYLHGHNNLLPAFEANLLGAVVGQKVEFKLSAADGYGEYETANLQEIDRAHLPAGQDPEPGMAILADFGGGQRPFPITKVTATHITIDLNHPLAGQELHFSVEVLEIRDAEPVEVAHGHVHVPGMHHH